MRKEICPIEMGNKLSSFCSQISTKEEEEEVTSLSFCHHYNKLFSLYRNLHGNKIQRLPYGLFDNMNLLKMLRLDSNLLECDCSVMWLVKHLQETKNHLNASASCKSPRVMEGKNLLDMSEDELHCSEFILILI